MSTSIMGPLRDMGPCEVWWSVDHNVSDPVQLGSYYETVGFRFSEEDADVFEAAFGTTPVDSIIIGQGPCEVVIPLTRGTYATLSLAMPGADYSAGAPSYIAIYANRVGISEFEYSGKLVIKPIVGASVGATNTWLNVKWAYPKPDFDISYDTRGQRVFNVTFKSFPDPTKKLVWWMGA